MQMLKQNFKRDCEIYPETNNGASPLKPYRTPNGVRIDAVNAVQIIYQ